MGIKPIPEGYHTATPLFVVPGVTQLINFMKQAFDAEELESFPRPDGTIYHAEVRIGDSIVMMGEPEGESDPMPGAIYLYVNDTDAAYRRALQAGAVSLMEPMDQPYGDRNAGVKDAFGNVWWLATHIADVSVEQKRAAASIKKQR